MNLFYRSDGSIEMLPVTNKPGDYIDFMAERDIIVTLSNCPYESANCNNWNATPMYAVLFKPNKAYTAKCNKLRKEKDASYRDFIGYSQEEYKSFLVRD
jgi:uncharacterized protein YcgI (DUF1989 family)